MEPSILKSVKKILNLPADYTAFDEDVLLHINSAFSDLNQLGIGPVEGFMIDDDTATWDQYVTPDVEPLYLQNVKTCISLMVRMLFDPPQTGYLVDAMERQIQQAQWRLNVAREVENFEEV